MQYIGARYVTKIYENSLDPSQAEWEANVNYEPLTMVTYNNGSYLSKKAVPGSAGNPPSEPNYWVQTGFYNGQIAALQADMIQAQQDILSLDGSVTSIGNSITTLTNNLNGHFTTIESAFDTTLSNGIVQKMINDAQYQALAITPQNSIIVGFSAYNSQGGEWWSNDYYPAPYQEMKTGTYTINVSNLAADDIYNQLITDLGTADIVGFEVTWNSTDVLVTNLVSKGSSVYVKVHNTYNTTISDTGTLKVYYYLSQNNVPKLSYVPVVVPKLRYVGGVSSLQVESLLPNQYAIGDTFRVTIYTYDNVVQL